MLRYCLNIVSLYILSSHACTLNIVSHYHRRNHSPKSLLRNVLQVHVEWHWSCSLRIVSQVECVYVKAKWHVTVVSEPGVVLGLNAPPFPDCGNSSTRTESYHLISCHLISSDAGTSIRSNKSDMTTKAQPCFSCLFKHEGPILSSRVIIF